MKLRFFFSVIFFSLVSSMCAQTDGENPTTQIPVEETQEGETDKIATPNPFNQPLKLPDFEPEESKEEKLALPVDRSAVDLDYERKKSFDMTEQSTLINPGVIFEKRWEDKKKKIALADKDGDFKRNINLGSFKTGSGKVNVVYRDHQVFDGDRIRILVNDDVVRPNVLLTTSYSGFNLNLQPGINKIDFVALNQGESGPNTAFIAVYDDNGDLVASNEWNLATGYKATIVVVKDLENPLKKENEN